MHMSGITPQSLWQTFAITTLTLILLAVSPVHAGAHDKLKLSGIASYEKLNTEYYLGALYLETPDTNAENILSHSGLKRMKVTVTTDKWRSRLFSKTWLADININNDEATQQAMGKEIFAFTKIAKDALVKGDIITIDHTPGKGSQIRINNTLVLSVKNDDYFAVILRAWIGARPPSTEFKDGILNLDNAASSDLVARMSVTVPTNKAARYATVSAWGIAATAPKPKKVAAPQPSAAEKAKKAEQARKAEAQRQAKIARQQEAARKAAAAKKAEAARQAEAAQKAEAARLAQIEAARIAEEKRLADEEAARIAEEKRLADEAKAKKKRLNPLRNRIREKMRNNVHNTYQDNITRLSQEKVIYPTKSLNKGEQGSVSLTISLNRDGKILHSDFNNKTPYVALNKAAEKAVKSANFPPLPDQLDDGEEFVVNIQFSL